MSKLKAPGVDSGVVNPGTSVREMAPVSGYFLPLGGPLAQDSEELHPSPEPIPPPAHDLGDIICRWEKKGIT